MEFNFNSYAVVDNIIPSIMEDLKKYERQPWQPALLVEIIETINRRVHDYINKKKLMFVDESNIMSIIANRISISLGDTERDEYDGVHRELQNGITPNKTVQQHLDEQKTIKSINFRTIKSLKDEQRRLEQSCRIKEEDIQLLNEMKGMWCKN